MFAALDDESEAGPDFEQSEPQNKDHPDEEDDNDDNDFVLAAKLVSKTAIVSPPQSKPQPKSGETAADNNKESFVIKADQVILQYPAHLRPAHH